MAGGLARLRASFVTPLAAAAVILAWAGLGDVATAQSSEVSMEDLSAGYEAWQSERTARRGSADARVAREQSRRAYAEQSASQALTTALNYHHDLVGAPAWRPFTVPPGATFDSYLGDHAASVTYPDGQRALVETTMPLRALDETASEAPVDLSLADQGPFFSPRTPLATLKLSKVAALGALLPDIRLRVAPVVDATAGLAARVSDKAFHGNVATDTDYIAIPVAGGVQAAWQLRSVDSPEQLELAFDLPPGAELRMSAPSGGPGPMGAIEVVRDGERLATVSVPVAWDADQEPVPLSFAVEGSTLVVSVPHRGGDWLYPLIVDPTVVEDQRYWRTNSSLDLTGWTYTENPSGASRWHWYYGDAWMGRGQYTYGTSSWFGNGEYGALRFPAPGDSYVYAAEFSYVRHAPDWQTLVSEGFWSGSTWQSGWASNQGGWPPGSSTLTPNYSPTSNSGTMDYTTTMHCVSGSNCLASAGANGNEARMALWTGGAGNRTDLQAYLGGAAVWLNDRNAPSGHGLSLSGISEGEWYGQRSFSATVFGSDRGLGVKQFKLKVPGYADRLRTHACAGHRLDRCPRDVTTYSNYSRISGDSFSGLDTAQMPEGYQTLSGQVADFAGNWSSADTELKIDHSAPDVKFSESLYDHRDQTVNHGVYRVRATGSDPYSGVTNVRVLLDGTELANVSQDQCDGCSLIAEATVSTSALPPGRHDVVAVATDAVGHVSETETFVFYTPEGAPCPLDPFVDQPPLAERPLESLGLCALWPL